MFTCIARVVGEHTRHRNTFLPNMTETEPFQKQLELPITKENDIIGEKKMKIVKNLHYTLGS